MTVHMEDPYSIDNARIRKSTRHKFKKIKISYSGYLWVGITNDKVVTATRLGLLVRLIKAG